MTDLSGEASSASGMSSSRPVLAAGESKRFEPFDVVRTSLGCLLLAAATLKGYELATAPVIESSLFNSRWFLILVVETELVLGLWLLSGLFAQVLWWIATIGFSAFASFTLYQALGGAESCGCFGKIQINPWYTFTIDVVAVGALMAFPPKAGQLIRQFSGRRLALVASLALFIGVPGGLAMAMYNPPALNAEELLAAEDGTVVLDPESWIDQPFPLHDHIDTEGQLMQGRWTVVLYKHDCPACQRALPRYEQVAQQWANASDDRRLALIEVAPYASSHGHVDPVPADTAAVRGWLSEQYDWFVRVPASLDLADGVVLTSPSAWLAQGSTALDTETGGLPATRIRGADRPLSLQGEPKALSHCARCEMALIASPG